MSGSSMRSASALAFMLTLVGGAVAGRAHAFTDTDRFAKPAGAGGGGGRYFTGSPVDGYGCNVCHQGGPEPKVQVLGLPEDGYVPGRLYEIEVVFEDPTLRHAAQLEFIGRDGKAAGTLLLIDQRQVDARARCGAMASEPPADYEIVAADRKVLGVEACGAQHMRFRFGPPNTPDVAFAISVVTSDRMGSVDGDGVFNLQKVLYRDGKPAAAKSCALSGAGSSEASPNRLPGALLLLLGLGWMRRRIRAARPRA